METYPSRVAFFLFNLKIITMESPEITELNQICWEYIRQMYQFGYSPDLFMKRIKDYLKLIQDKILTIKEVTETVRTELANIEFDIAEKKQFEETYPLDDIINSYKINFKQFIIEMKRGA